MAVKLSKIIPSASQPVTVTALVEPVKLCQVVTLSGDADAEALARNILRDQEALYQAVERAFPEPISALCEYVLACGVGLWPPPTEEFLRRAGIVRTGEGWRVV
jgi:hypothetical protein